MRIINDNSPSIANTPYRDKDDCGIQQTRKSKLFMKRIYIQECHPCIRNKNSGKKIVCCRNRKQERNEDKNNFQHEFNNQLCKTKTKTLNRKRKNVPISTQYFQQNRYFSIYNQYIFGVHFTCVRGRIVQIALYSVMPDNSYVLSYSLKIISCRRHTVLTGNSHRKTLDIFLIFKYN